MSEPGNVPARRPLQLQDIEIEGDMIRLGQLLKLTSLADSGADARELLLANVVTVNGDVETRRGRQLPSGRPSSSGRADRPGGLTGSSRSVEAALAPRRVGSNALRGSS